jgi:hypothetical protein
MRIAALCMALFSCARSSGGSEADAGKVLDAWHDAAARADENAYFSHFASNGVFLGTDAKERWPVAAFREYAHPHFAKGKAWAFKSVRRAITLSGDARVAWFDEDLATPHLGPARGSGVLVHENGAWKIALYDLSVPIPNEKFKDVKAVIDR